MKVIDFKEIENCSYFWLYFLSTAFPLAYDEKEDINLAEFIYENYDLEIANEWIDEFVQYNEDIMQENDGYSENPTAIVIETNGDKYTVQYHPGDTLYFKEDEEISSTGAHYDIHKITFSNFATIKQNCGFISVLLLPIVYINETEVDEAFSMIQTFLEKMPVNEEHRNQITNMIIEGIRA